MPGRILREIEFLKQGQVNLRGSRTDKNVYTRVPESVVARRDKIGRVEPSLDGGIVDLSGSDAIRPLPSAAGIQKAADHDRSERCPRDECIDTIDAPPANDSLGESASAGCEALPASERQLIGPTQDDAVTDVEVGIPSLKREIVRILDSGTVGISAGVIEAVCVRVSALKIQSG